MIEVTVCFQLRTNGSLKSCKRAAPGQPSLSDNGRQVEMPEEELINRIRYLKKTVLSAVSAAVQHQDPVLRLTPWWSGMFPTIRYAEASGLMAEFKEVTHCYQRPGKLAGHITFYHGTWPFNEECVKIAEKIARDVGINNTICCSAPPS